jgi:hypothetical protein
MQPYLSGELTMFILLSIVTFALQVAAGIDPPEGDEYMHIKAPATHPISASPEPKVEVKVEEKGESLPWQAGLTFGALAHIATVEEETKPRNVATTSFKAKSSTPTVVSRSMLPAWFRFFGLRARRSAISRVGMDELID